MDSRISPKIGLGLDSDIIF